ncbi:MAG: FAD-dependent oxidoreductase [Ruminococcus sp.]|nr:FAD-dependent oxidoreductase [Ruminococcus sp.]
MFDLIILGSGPAGLTASIYAARAGLRFTVIEKEYMGTGQIAYAERVDNYPGFYGLDGYTLGEKFREHAEALGTKFNEGKVTALANADGVWSITFSDGCTTQTKAVIYALGASPRKLGIPGEAELTGRGVSYCALCDGAFFAGKAVAVIGGGDTALSDALYLSKSAEKVYLVHRRDTFRANKALTDKVLAVPNIQPVYNAVPAEIIGTDKVTRLRLSDGELAVEGVFIAIGTVPNTKLLDGLSVLDGYGYIRAGEDGVTPAEGLFAAGDVRTKAVRQVITAAADGANAVNSVCIYLNSLTG